MVELARTRVAVALVTASAEAVDAAVDGLEAIRTAPDEALVLGAPGSGADVAARVGKRALAVDDDALALDATDGWAAWTLSGADAHAAFAYLSMLHLPEGDGWTQGEVARVPAKVLTKGERLTVLVPAMWEAHVRERVLTDCASLGLTEATDPHVWTSAPKAATKKRASASKKRATGAKEEPSP